MKRLSLFNRTPKPKPAPQDAPKAPPKAAPKFTLFPTPKPAFAAAPRAAAKEEAFALAPQMAQGSHCTRDEEARNLIEQTLRTLLQLTQASAGHVMQLEMKSEALISHTALALGEPFEFPSGVHFSEGMEGGVVFSQSPLCASRADRATNQESPLQNYAHIPSVEAALCVPIRGASEQGKETTLGTLTLIHRQKGKRFAPQEIAWAQILAGMIATAWMSVRYYRRHRSSVLISLERIVEAMECGDPASQGHSRRVAEVCRRLAIRMGLNEEEVQLIYIGALLHDIGKVYIPMDILRKPGMLDHDELKLVKQYPTVGYEMVQPFGLEEEILTCIRSHAERLDASGYPDSLTMQDVPLPIRILCVVDAFDAMSSYRAYRPALDARLRNEQLNRFAGTQFDPLVVEALKDLLNNNELDDLYLEVWSKSNPGIGLNGEPLAQAA